MLCLYEDCFSSTAVLNNRLNPTGSVKHFVEDLFCKDGWELFIFLRVTWSAGVALSLPGGWKGGQRRNGPVWPETTSAVVSIMLSVLPVWARSVVTLNVLIAKIQTKQKLLSCITWSSLLWSEMQVHTECKQNTAEFTWSTLGWSV